MSTVLHHNRPTVNPVILEARLEYFQVVQKIDRLYGLLEGEINELDQKDPLIIDKLDLILDKQKDIISKIDRVYYSK